MTRETGIRQEQAARRRELLLTTAYELFSTRGYRRTSVRDITRAAGVTEAVLYHYFTGKADLMTAVLERFAPVSAYRRIFTEAAGASLEETLRVGAAEFLRLLRERRAFVTTLLSEAAGEPELAAVLNAMLRGIVSDIGVVLRQRQQAGTIEASVSVEAAAQALQGGLLSRFLSTAFVGQSSDAATSDDEYVAQLTHVLLTGLVPRDGHGHDAAST